MRFRSWYVAVAIAAASAALACGPELTDPASTNVTGTWVSSDTVAIVHKIRLELTQSANGVVTGSWNGTTIPSDGSCPEELGCFPVNTVSGSNTVLQLYLSVLGLGYFTGQVTSSQTLHGNVETSFGNFTIDLVKLGG